MITLVDSSIGLTITAVVSWHKLELLLAIIEVCICVLCLLSHLGLTLPHELVLRWVVSGLWSCFTLLLLPWFLGLAIPSLPAHWSWLDGLTPQHHLDQLTRGVLDSRSVVLVASVTVVALRAAVLALEQERLK